MVASDQEHQSAVDAVATALARLDAAWTVLEAPRLGLERPDAVVLHETHGVCAITVTALRPGGAERDADGFLVVPGRDERLPDQPHLAAERIGRQIYDAHYADLDDPSESDGAVRWLLVAPHLDDASARALFGARGATDADVAATVWGSGFFEQAEAAVIGRPSTAPPVALLSPVSRVGLRRLLAGSMLGPRDDVAPPSPAVIRPATAPLVAPPSASRLRRVRGPGGSGKSFALTTRAAALAAEGRSVLVLSFTTTLADRLIDLVRMRAAEQRADARHVTITNFHALCEHTVVTAEAAGHRSVWPEGSRWPIAIVDRARQVIEQGFDHRYDAILVDEGQDFSLEWWSMLRSHYLAEGGEMLVTADETQDLYRVEPWFDEDQMRELGFDEPWVELTDSVRTPDDLVPALEVIGDREVPVAGAEERDVLVGDPIPSVRRWVDIDRVADLGREIGREVVRLVRDHPTLAPGDVVFLCDYHHDGLAAVREIERAGIPVHHQFSRDPAGRSIRRRRFSPTSSAVKGATVHGFKGCETGALVMGIGADATSPALAAIAIERVGTPPTGGSAIVTVVNGDRSRREPAAQLRWDDPLGPVVLPPEQRTVAGPVAPPRRHTVTSSSASERTVASPTMPPPSAPHVEPSDASMPAPSPAIAESVEWSSPTRMPAPRALPEPEPIGRSAATPLAGPPTVNEPPAVAEPPAISEPSAVSEPHGITEPPATMPAPLATPLGLPDVGMLPVSVASMSAGHPHPAEVRPHGELPSMPSPLPGPESPPTTVPLVPPTPLAPPAPPADHGDGGAFAPPTL